MLVPVATHVKEKNRKHETKPSLIKMRLYKEKQNGSDTNCMIPCIKGQTISLPGGGLWFFF